MLWKRPTAKEIVKKRMGVYTSTDDVGVVGIDLRGRSFLTPLNSVCFRLTHVAVLNRVSQWFGLFQKATLVVQRPCFVLPLVRCMTG